MSSVVFSITSAVYFISSTACNAEYVANTCLSIILYLSSTLCQTWVQNPSAAWTETWHSHSRHTNPSRVMCTSNLMGRVGLNMLSSCNCFTASLACWKVSCSICPPVPTSPEIQAASWSSTGWTSSSTTLQTGNWREPAGIQCSCYSKPPVRPFP